MIWMVAFIFSETFCAVSIQVALSVSKQCNSWCDAFYWCDIFHRVYLGDPDHEVRLLMLSMYSSRMADVVSWTDCMRCIHLVWIKMQSTDCVQVRMDDLSVCSGHIDMRSLMLDKAANTFKRYWSYFEAQKSWIKDVLLSMWGTILVALLLGWNIEWAMQWLYCYLRHKGCGARLLCKVALDVGCIAIS